MPVCTSVNNSKNSSNVPKPPGNTATALAPGHAALCVLVRKATADKVLPAMAEFGGKVLHTSLSTEQEAKLQDALKAV